jgi:hypothetical protein
MTRRGRDRCTLHRSIAAIVLVGGQRGGSGALLGTVSTEVSMTDEVASVNVVSCEMNRDGPGGSPSLSFTSKPPEERGLSNISQLLHKTIMLSAITRHTTVCVQIFELSLLFE